MTDDEVQSTLVRWVKKVTGGLTTIKDRQNIKPPTGSYLLVEKGTVDELSSNPSSIDHKELESLNSEGLKEIEATPNIELEWVMLVYAYGENASDSLRKIKQAAHLVQIQESLGASLIIHDTGVINSIPELVGQQWEDRFQLNVTLRGVASDGFIIDTIETNEPFIYEAT